MENILKINKKYERGTSNFLSKKTPSKKLTKKSLINSFENPYPLKKSKTPLFLGRFFGGIKLSFRIKNLSFNEKPGK